MLYFLIQGQLQCSFSLRHSFHVSCFVGLACVPLHHAGGSAVVVGHSCSEWHFCWKIQTLSFEQLFTIQLNGKCRSWSSSPSLSSLDLDVRGGASSTNSSPALSVFPVRNWVGKMCLVHSYILSSQFSNGGHVCSLLHCVVFRNNVLLGDVAKPGERSLFRRWQQWLLSYSKGVHLLSYVFVSFCVRCKKSSSAQENIWIWPE